MYREPVKRFFFSRTTTSQFKAALYQTYYGCCSVTVVCSDSGHFGQSYTKQYPCSTPRRRLLHSRSLCCHAMLLPTKIGSEAGKTPRDVFAFMCCMRGVYPEKTCPGQGQKVTLPPNFLPFWPHMTYDVAQATGLNSPRGNLLLIVIWFTANVPSFLTVLSSK